MVARETNGRGDRDEPVYFLNRSLWAWRTRSTLSKSTSTEVHTAAAVVCDAFMPAAPPRRLRDSCCPSSRGPPPAVDDAVAAAAAGAGAGRLAGAWAGAA